MSCLCKKWPIIEPEQKIAKIQGLLDLALQCSSCGNDLYKERLFAYAKGQNVLSEPTSANGTCIVSINMQQRFQLVVLLQIFFFTFSNFIYYLLGLHAFNFMALGYRVDWPVNIIITQDALKTYADIFSYLFQVRLAVISLTDVWHWLKVSFL